MLRECLELTASLDWLANVEIKSFPNQDPRLFQAVKVEVQAAGQEKRVLISSFDHRDVARVIQADLPWASGALSHTPLFRPERYVREILGADCFHTSTLALSEEAVRRRSDPSMAYLDTEAVAKLTDAGIPTLIYTVNDARPGGLADRLARAGVAGLFTDDPARILGLFAAREMYEK